MPSPRKHALICACWHMLYYRELYRDLGDFFRRRNPNVPRNTSSDSAKPFEHSGTLDQLLAA